MLLQEEERATARRRSAGHFGMRRELCHYYRLWAGGSHAIGDVPAPPPHLLASERDAHSDSASTKSGAASTKSGRPGSGGFTGFLRRGFDFGARLGATIVSGESMRRQHANAAVAPSSPKHAETLPPPYSNGYVYASAQHSHSSASFPVPNAHSSNLSKTSDESPDGEDDQIWSDCITAASSAEQCPTPNHNYSAC